MLGDSMNGAPAGVVTLRGQDGPPQEVVEEKNLDEVRFCERELRMSATPA